MELVFHFDFVSISLHTFECIHQVDRSALLMFNFLINVLYLSFTTHVLTFRFEFACLFILTHQNLLQKIYFQNWFLQIFIVSQVPWPCMYCWFVLQIKFVQDLQIKPIQIRFINQVLSFLFKDHQPSFPTWIFQPQEKQLFNEVLLMIDSMRFEDF